MEKMLENYILDEVNVDKIIDWIEDLGTRLKCFTEKHEWFLYTSNGQKRRICKHCSKCQRLMEHTHETWIERPEGI